MFSSIFMFEVRRWLRSASVYIYFLLLFVIAFLIGIASAGAFDGISINYAGERVFANSPVLIDGLFSGIDGFVGLIIIVAIVGNAVLKDFRYDTYSIIYTTPVSKASYVWGRFAASFFIVMIVLMAPGFGMMAAYASPWVSPAKVEAFSLMPYIQCYWQSVLPNALLGSGLFFAVSLIARDIFVIWLSLIIFFVATGISGSLVSTLEHETLKALIDPWGDEAKSTLSKYWTTDQKNHLLYQLRGLFLLNRVIWVGISGIILAIGYNYFSFTSSPRRLFFKKKKISENAVSIFTPIDFNRQALPAVTQSFTTGDYLKSLWGLAVNECRTLLRNTYFRIILLFGMVLLFATATQIGKWYDTTTLPVTYQVAEYMSGVLHLFIIVLTIMFAGDLVWKAREARMSNILDALPVPNWVYYVSKLAGLFFIQALLQTIILISGLIVQTFKGYTHYELLLYAKYLYAYSLPGLWLFAVMAVLIQTLVSNKYIGFFIAAIFYIWNTTFALLVLKQHVFIYGSGPGVQYSDMNGFGHGVYPFVLYKFYWAMLGLILAILSSLLWARGSESRLKLRWAKATGKGTRPAWMVILLCGIVFITCGSFIWYNTNVDNKFYTEFQQEELQAKYEKKYKKFEHAPQPKITDVKVNIDIYPNERNLHSTGTYVLKNKTSQPVDSIHIYLPETNKIRSLSFTTPATLALDDSIYAYRIYRLSKPLQPGDSLTMSFTVDLVTHGFENDFSGLSTPLYNGTFMNNTDCLPSIGYNRNIEMSDNNRRKKHGLGYRPTANPITDTAAYQRNLFVADADFINFEATLSTVPDQIAIAPGYLQKEWMQNGRRYFHYKMDSRILNFYSFLSARYQVKKEMYNGISLEIYYNKGHEYNLERMMNGMKDALAYYSSQFSPYQHRQVRILEFPRYATFAQSFPNTIPFSEGIGFIASVDDSSKEDVDYPYYVTAHEVAHQWFAHQVIGADVAGSNMLSESLAQYGAIMVMEHKYGAEKIRKFLHYEMDNYLRSRSGEAEKENPLAYVDAGQGYILYQKGGIVMHAMNKYIGEDSLNHALKRFITKYAFQGPPYPTTLDLIAELRKSTPDSLQYFITDAFQKIILYDNKVEQAKSVKNSDGTYTIDATVSSKKISSDSTGKETPVPSNDYIEIGVYNSKRKMLQLKTYKLKQGETRITMTVNELPEKIVIDPRELLIDKKLDDNEMRLNGDKAIARK